MKLKCDNMKFRKKCIHVPGINCKNEFAYECCKQKLIIPRDSFGMPDCSAIYQAQTRDEMNKKTYVPAKPYSMSC